MRGADEEEHHLLGDAHHLKRVAYSPLPLRRSHYQWCCRMSRHRARASSAHSCCASNLSLWRTAASASLSGFGARPRDLRHIARDDVKGACREVVLDADHRLNDLSG